MSETEPFLELVLPTTIELRTIFGWSCVSHNAPLLFVTVLFTIVELAITVMENLELMAPPSVAWFPENVELLTLNNGVQ